MAEEEREKIMDTNRRSRRVLRARTHKKNKEKRDEMVASYIQGKGQ